MHAREPSAIFESENPFEFVGLSWCCSSNAAHKNNNNNGKNPISKNHKQPATIVRGECGYVWDAFCIINSGNNNNNNNNHTKNVANT